MSHGEGNVRDHGITLRVIIGAAAMILLSASACSPEVDFDPEAPAEGPGVRMETQTPMAIAELRGGADFVPQARELDEPLDFCDGACRSWCASQDWQNPINKALCPEIWGLGIESAPIRGPEACRRMITDTTGVMPDRGELRSICGDEDWDAAARELIDSEDFVFVQQRRWADYLRYSAEVVNVRRIWDMDEVVGHLHRGALSWDTFAAVVSAHPVFTRRYDTAADRADALFLRFLGRPPLGDERADFARLYTLWQNEYIDEPALGRRVPDSHIRYRCVDDYGNVDENTAGECTSIKWGYNQVILRPDARSSTYRNNERRMWSGLLTAEEWHILQTPGRIIASEPVFWETLVDEVVETYLGYSLGELVPGVRSALVDHVLDHGGDVRALHHAVLTSLPYLQSAQSRVEGVTRAAEGPLKQVDPEVWLDSLARFTGNRAGACDHRIPQPEQLLRDPTPSSLALVQASRWELDDEGSVRNRYRNMARSIGGCPENVVGGRFKVVSLLTTATQLSWVNDVCDPQGAGGGADIAALLPSGTRADTVLTQSLAEDILEAQTRLFLARSPTDAEREDARTAGERCERTLCRAEEFARPMCFSILSSPEMIFY